MIFYLPDRNGGLGGTLETLLQKLFKGQLNSEWIYEVIVSSKMPTKTYRNFGPGSLLEGMAEISVIFGWHFGKIDDLINSFWI